MEPLREMFRHHAWATLTLMDSCMSLAPEQLQQAVPGTYGPIQKTFTHLVGADQRYLEGMLGEPVGAPIRPGEVLSLAELRQRFEAQTQHWDALLDRVDQLDVTLPARGPYTETPHAQNLLLLQAIHHGNDHRTHICTALSVLGLEPPDIDGWSYWGATYQQGG